jgi:HEAT repeat protein
MEHSAARRDAAALLEQATHRDKNVRAAVAPELRKLAADPAARKLIVAALTDPAWRIRFAAVRAVGFKGTNIAPPEAIHLALRDPVASVRWAAVHATPERDVNSNLVPLANTDPEATVRAAAVHRFWRIQGEAAITLGIRCLADQDERVRFAAAVLLRDRGDPRARAALVDALGDRFMWIREQAIQGLAQIGGSEVVEPIAECLYDRKRLIRWQAGRALGRVGDRRAVEPLLALLARSTSALGRSAAVVGLGHLRDQRAVAPIAETLHDVWTTDPHEGNLDLGGRGRGLFELRRDTTKALLRLGGAAAEEELAQLPAAWVSWVRGANLF